jgi:hypothetical protein
MSGYFDPAPRDRSVAPPGYEGTDRSRTPFTRHRASLDRHPQPWGNGVQSGSAYVPTIAYEPYEPITAGSGPRHTEAPPMPAPEATKTSKRSPFRSYPAS